MNWGRRNFSWCRRLNKRGDRKIFKGSKSAKLINREILMGSGPLKNSQKSNIQPGSDLGLKKPWPNRI